MRDALRQRIARGEGQSEDEENVEEFHVGLTGTIISKMPLCGHIRYRSDYDPGAGGAKVSESAAKIESASESRGDFVRIALPLAASFRPALRGEVAMESPKLAILDERQWVAWNLYRRSTRWLVAALGLCRIPATPRRSSCRRSPQAIARMFQNRSGPDRARLQSFDRIARGCSRSRTASSGLPARTRRQQLRQRQRRERSESQGSVTNTLQQKRRSQPKGGSA